MKNIVYVMRLLPALLLFLPSVMAWSQDDDLLEPDKAFALQDPVVSADKITLTWKVASGYYLYQNKFSFELAADSSRLDKPQMPESIRKQDEFFGEVEIYKKSVSVDLPLLRDGSDAESVVLTAVFQGCNDPIGVCYPPINKKLKIDLPAVISTANAADLQPVASSSPKKSRSVSP